MEIKDSSEIAIITTSVIRRDINRKRTLLSERANRK